MPRDAAICRYWMSDYIIEGTYYADDERNKINNETDPKKGEHVCIKKINVTYFFLQREG